MNSPDFESLPFEVQQNAFLHYQATIQRLYSIPQLPTPQPVRTTLQLKGTVDPTTAAQILDRSGVPEASPQNLSSPPLDTWVTDDISKTDVDTGNTHLDAMAKLQDMQQSQDKHELDQAEAAHKVALAQARVHLAHKKLQEPAAPQGGS